MLVTTSTMTNRISRLARAGYVQRATDARDGRVVLVRLTVEGKAVVDAAMADLLAWEAELLEGLDAGAQAELAGLLRRLAAPFEESGGSARRPPRAVARSPRGHSRRGWGPA